MGRRNNLYELLIAALIIIGFVADFFRHLNHTAETLFAVPHLLEYLGMIAAVVRVLWISLQDPRSEHSAESSIGSLAAIAFLAGAIGDTILHLNGVEDTSSLLARPTHMLILLGGAMGLYALSIAKGTATPLLPILGAVYAVAVFVVAGPSAITVVVALIFGFAFGAYVENKQTNDRNKQIAAKLWEIADQLNKEGM